MSLQLPNIPPSPQQTIAMPTIDPQPEIALPPPAAAAPPTAAAATAAAPAPAPVPRLPPPLTDQVKSVFQPEDFFGHQPTPTSQLPAPQTLLENLTRCVIEVMAGARDLDQLARWVTDSVYRHLLIRVIIATRGRAERGEQAQRPVFVLGQPRIYQPRDGIVEAVVLVHYRSGRVRAVALRLEGLDGRWRASAINVL